MNSFRDLQRVSEMAKLHAMPIDVLIPIVENVLEPRSSAGNPELAYSNFSRTETIVSMFETCDGMRRACQSPCASISYVWKDFSFFTPEGSDDFRSRNDLNRFLHICNRSLRSLTLHSTQIGTPRRAVEVGAIMARLPVLENLTKLEISYHMCATELFVRAVQYRQYMPQGSGLEPGLRMPNLEDLTLEGWGIMSFPRKSVVDAILGDAAHGGEPRFPRLTRLSMDVMGLLEVDSAEKLLSSETGKNLKHLRLVGGIRGAHPDEVFALVHKHCKKLESLTLDTVDAENPQDPMPALLPMLMAGISSLSLHSTLLNKETLEGVMAAGFLKHLEVCFCCGFVPVSSIVKAVSENQCSPAGLESLTLTKFNDLTDEHVALLCGKCGKTYRKCALKRLVVVACSHADLALSGFENVCEAKRERGEALEVRLVDNWFDVGDWSARDSSFGTRRRGNLIKPGGIENVLEFSAKEMSEYGRRMLVSIGK